MISMFISHMSLPSDISNSHFYYQPNPCQILKWMPIANKYISHSLTSSEMKTSIFKCMLPTVLSHQNPTLGESSPIHRLQL